MPCCHAPVSCAQVPNQPDAFEFSIRTPVTPPRWAEFDAELEAAWEAVVASMLQGKRHGGRAAGQSVGGEEGAQGSYPFTGGTALGRGWVGSGACTRGGGAWGVRADKTWRV